MKKLLAFSLMICLYLGANIAWSDIIHVPGDQPTIQAGIDAAQHGDTVLVANGIYKGAGNKNLDFGGKAITVTSENGAENCIIDCQGMGRVFYFHSGETEESVVSGFKIVNGLISHDQGGKGGGIFCENSSPTIENNIIARNSASEEGGGIYCHYSSPTIRNNQISENEGGNGGGIFCSINSSPTIQNNLIKGNSAIYEGGGINCYISSPAIQNNIITENEAINGGGIFCNNSPPTIQNNLIRGNSALKYGGGIYFYASSHTIINNTLSGNSARYAGGGIYCGSSSSPTVLNTILWGDSPYEIDVDDISRIDITYSDIQGGWEGEGNIDADPLFVDPDNGDFHLSNYSLCIGAGIMTPDVPSTDIEGNPRPNPPGSNPDMGAYENPLAEPPGSINGYVTNLAGNPIPKAIVIAINTTTKEKAKAFTDANGYYEMLDLPPATYWVLCVKKSYQAGIAKVEVEPGAVTPCNFVLRWKVE